MSKITKDLKYVNGKAMKLNEKNILDQYFTKPQIANQLYKTTRKIISRYDKLSNFTWLEPSAGNGVFFDLLPKNKKIGIDIEPKIKNLIKMDYLDYKFPKNKKIIVLGNPPFGHRGVIALNFINHSFDAEYVCFILPMFFESTGKGSIKYRVNGFNLIYSEKLPRNAFYNPNNGKDVKIECVFQIWSKNHKLNNDEFSWYNNNSKEPFSEYIKVYTVSLAKNRECGKRWIFDEKADFYISSTFYNNTEIVYNFADVKYKSGIAVVFQTHDKKIQNKILQIYKKTNWENYGTKATNSCYHLGKSNIYKILSDNINKIKE